MKETVQQLIQVHRNKIYIWSIDGRLLRELNYTKASRALERALQLRAWLIAGGL